MSADPQEFLDEAEIDEETLEESLRAYVFQSSDFLPPDRMRAALTEACGEDPVADVLKMLEADSEARSALARALLQTSWAVPGEAEKIRRRPSTPPRSFRWSNCRSRRSPCYTAIGCTRPAA